jgi:hypothetical protein
MDLLRQVYYSPSSSLHRFIGEATLGMAEQLIQPCKGLVNADRKMCQAAGRKMHHRAGRIMYQFLAIK